MFKKFLAAVLTVMTVVSAMSLSVIAENDEYTIKQYIYDYYTDIYKENISLFTKITLRNTEQSDEVWHLSNDIDKYDLFNNEISKVDTSYIVQTEKRYFITFQSPNDNLLYLCITENGELFFGRYADYNKPNYCEYIIKDVDKALNQLSELCEVDKVFFNDTIGHWAESAINKWADKGIVSGYPDGTFKPDNPVTRAELAKVLTLAFDLQPSEYVFDKREVNGNEWYYNYLLCAGKYIPNYALPEINEKNQPYIDNRTVNAFLPEQNAMRMHVAESLVEIVKNKEQSIIDVPDITVVKEELNKTFKDAEYEELFANHGMIPENVRRMFEYTYLANKLGIMQGDTDGYFRPYDNVTRAELITMLDRIIAE